MTDGSAEPRFEVEAAADAVWATIGNALKLVRRSSAAEVSFGFENGALEISVPGVVLGIPATGCWPGAVRVATRSLRALIGVGPPAGSLKLSVEGGRLKIGDFLCICTVHENPGPRIDLPIHPTLVQLLELRLTHSMELLRAQGHAAIVEEAEAQRDELIAQAAAALKPLGIKAAALRRVVDEQIAAGARRQPTP